MENNLFTTLLSTADQSHVAFNSASSHMISGQFMHPDTIGHNTHEQIMASGSSSPSRVQDELLNNLYMPNNCRMANNGIYFAEGCSGNIDMVTSLSAASLANLLPRDICSGQGMYSINDSAASALPLNMRSTDRCGSFNDYGIQDGLGHDEALKVISTVHPSYHVTASAWPSWNLNNSNMKFARSDNYLQPRNELSLSLGSCQPPIVSMPDFPDHCSEKSCSVVTQVTPKDSEELSLYCGPSSSVHFSHVLLGSRYLDVAQKVLAEFVNYALGDSEELDDSVSGVEGEARVSFSSSCSRAKGLLDVGSDEFTSSSEIKSQDNIDQLMLEEHKTQKTKLVTMLQMVDNRYNQCLDHIQNVITTFHDATNSSSPQMLARFTLQTVASAFRKLRERITSHILLASQEGGKGFMRGKEKAFESSSIEKQWALQLGRKDQQCWRPQRGLPERSVSVLKAWMFQNFLHPYPKDNDKNLLAMQSGLTRSQVSNWFINARVRLWKPMIEEMYSEIRKHQTEEGVEGDIGFHENISNQRPYAD